MSAHKHKEHLERIKEHVVKSDILSENEKSDTIKCIDEWLLEDKASGTFVNELLKITQNIKPLLAELGFI